MLFPLLWQGDSFPGRPLHHLHYWAWWAGAEHLVRGPGEGWQQWSGVYLAAGGPVWWPRGSGPAPESPPANGYLSPAGDIAWDPCWRSGLGLCSCPHSPPLRCSGWNTDAQETRKGKKKTCQCDLDRRTCSPLCWLHPFALLGLLKMGEEQPLFSLAASRVCFGRHVLSCCLQNAECWSGVWQILVWTDTAKFTTFITSISRFFFNHLPFGIALVPEHFQCRMVSDITEGL